MSDKFVYEEKISSIKTEGLFLILTTVFLLITVILLQWDEFWLVTLVAFLFFLFFLFYSLNYRTLYIKINQSRIILKFGIFTKNIIFNEINNCRLDKTSMWRIGGAGIHATKLKGVWRMMFNFIEYDRVIVTKNTGFYKDIVFSTKFPEKIIEILKKS